MQNVSLQAASRRLGFASVTVLLGALFAGTAPAQAKYVRDEAGMFKPDTIASIESRNGQLVSSTGKFIQVVTTDTTSGTPINQAAAQEARALSVNGAIIYIAKADRQLSIAYGRKARLAFPADLQAAIKDKLRASFRRADYDGGILTAVNTIADRMQAAPAPQSQAAGQPVAQSNPGNGGIPLIWWIVGLGALFLILRSFAKRSAAPTAGPNVAGNPPVGYPPGGGYGFGGGGGGGFMPGLLGGALGGFVGNELANNMNRGGAEGPDPAAAATEPGGDWSGSDAGGGFVDAGGGGDFGGGGGGGDTGGGW